MADTKIVDLTLKSVLAMTDEFVINDVAGGNLDKKVTVEGIGNHLIVRIAGNSGAVGEHFTLQRLTGNATDNSTLTATVVMTTTGLVAGTYKFKFTIIYQTAATTTGIGLFVNYTGTNGLFSTNWWHVTTGGAAATGVGDGVTATVAGQLVEGKSERAKNTMSSASAGVDTQNANVQAMMEGIIVVTGAGNLQLKMVSEVDTSAVRIMADSMLELTRIV